MNFRSLRLLTSAATPGMKYGLARVSTAFRPGATRCRMWSDGNLTCDLSGLWLNVSPGCRGKPARKIKNRMISDLSIFAARLRDFISICADEPAFGSAEAEPALRAHADAEFNGLALVLFALQFKHNRPYRKFCEARKSPPDAIAHWAQIPAVPAAAFKQLELSCLPAGERTTVFHSSGTTEQRPGRHFHSAESLAVYEAASWPWFRRHVVPDLRFTIYDLRATRPQSDSNATSAIILTPPPAQAPHSSLVHMLAAVWRSAFRRPPGLGPPEGGTPNDVFAAEVSRERAWVLNPEKLLRALNRSIQSRHPLVLLGTAFSFVHLLDYLAEEHLRFELPPGSRVMETGGYKGRSRALPKAELHSLITERLAIRPSHIVCEYGMSELSSQAYDRVAGDGSGASATQNSKLKTQNFLFPPWARVQIISPESGREVAEGETGLLRVCDLANVFSVMAVQTEDLAIRRGDGFELIGRAELAEPRGCSLMSLDSQIANRKS